MAMKKEKKTRALHLFQAALDSPMGILVASNDASRLQQELGIARVEIRSEGMDDFDLLSFRVYKPEDEELEYVMITKKLNAEQVAQLIREKDAPNG